MNLNTINTTNPPLHIIPTLALLGTPNCGKTAVFNVLTGSHQRVGNFPGITVDKKVGFFNADGIEISVIDLPGIYSLDSNTIDEHVTRDVLIGTDEIVGSIDGFIFVVDATNIKKSLYLALELKKLNLPMIIAVNLMDISRKRGQILDFDVLEKAFSCPVVGISANLGEGFSKLKSHAFSLSQKSKLELITDRSLHLDEISKLDTIKTLYKEVHDLEKSLVKQPLAPDTMTKKIDSFVLHPILGPIITLIVLFAMFQAIFTLAPPLQDIIDGAFGYLGARAGKFISQPDLNSLVVDGIIGGVGAFMTFLPPILLLFLFILTLEDFGYLGRVAFLLDGLMRKLGLPGKAVVPLLASHACQVPGVMAARTLSNERDRLATIIVSPITTCSAKIPVFAMLIAAFISADTTVGPFNLGGIVMLFIYLLGIALTFLAAFVLKKTIITGSASGLFMQLPEYRIPKVKNIAIGVLNRAKNFVKKVGTVIVFLTVVIWFLTTYPKAENGQQTFEQSYAAKIGKTFQPIFQPLGFDWKITASLIPSFGAREVVVASMGTVLSVQQGLSDDELEDPMVISKLMGRSYSVPTILSLIAWFLFAPQCIALFGAIARETASRKWTFFAMFFNFGLAYLAAFLTYQIALLF
ncbi:ferrous iron transport protein B [Bacteriovoracaceae bacterium]|nr:ferrous iron transport protein B [Bacteriovoracaceae bacterium]